MPLGLEIAGVPAPRSGGDDRRARRGHRHALRDRLCDRSRHHSALQLRRHGRRPRARRRAPRQAHPDRRDRGRDRRPLLRCPAMASSPGSSSRRSPPRPCSPDRRRGSPADCGRCCSPSPRSPPPCAAGGAGCGSLGFAAGALAVLAAAAGGRAILAPCPSRSRPRLAALAVAALAGARLPFRRRGSASAALIDERHRPAQCRGARRRRWRRARRRRRRPHRALRRNRRGHRAGRDGQPRPPRRRPPPLRPRPPDLPDRRGPSRLDRGRKATLERSSERLEALSALMRSPVDCGRLVDVDLAFGIADPPTPATRASRSPNAALAAERAACARRAAGERFAGAAEEIDWHLSLLGELDAAMVDGQVWNAYQPKLDIATGRIVGVEALVRWDHPERGAIGPDRFIPLVEAHGRARDLTLHVLRRALEDAAALARGRARSSASPSTSRRPCCSIAAFVGPARARDRAARLPAELGDAGGDRIRGDEGQRTRRSPRSKAGARSASASRSTITAPASRRSPICRPCRRPSSRSTRASSPTSPPTSATRSWSARPSPWRTSSA